MKYLSFVLLCLVESNVYADSFQLLEEQSVSFSDRERTLRLDLGTLLADSKFQLDVEIKNTSSIPFTPVESKSTCSCAAGLIKGSEISPGDSGSIRIRIASPRKEGRFTQAITILPKERTKPLVLYVSGMAERWLKLKPSVIEGADEGSVTRSCEVASAFEEVDFSSLSFESLSSSAAVLSQRKSEDQVSLKINMAAMSAATGATSTVKILAKGHLKNGEEIAEELVLIVRNPRAWSIKPSTLMFSWDEKHGKWIGRFFCFSPMTKPVESEQFKTFQVQYDGEEHVELELTELETKPFGLAGAIALEQQFQTQQGKLVVILPGGKSLGLAAKFDMSSKEID